MIELLHKYPRLYIDAPLSCNAQISLPENQLHYLKNVLRKKEKDSVRIFNGVEGEWLAEILTLSKKQGTLSLSEKIKDQLHNKAPIHLFFAPLKKQRLDILIEKAVELGVDALHPVITNRTENRKFNFERIQAQTIEASEQCERLDIPKLYEPIKLEEMMNISQIPPLYACIERGKSNPLSSYTLDKGASFLIGPEGGFDDDELLFITSKKGLFTVNLGKNILRAETAATLCLSYAYLCAAP